MVSWVLSSAVKRAHFRSFNSAIVKCFHSPHRIAWIGHFFLRKEPWQREDNQLSFLLELNLLFDGSEALNKSKQNKSIDSKAETRSQNKTLEASLASLSRNETRAGPEVRHICIRSMRPRRKLVPYPVKLRWHTELEDPHVRCGVHEGSEERTQPGKERRQFPPFCIFCQVRIFLGPRNNTEMRSAKDRHQSYFSSS